MEPSAKYAEAKLLVNFALGSKRDSPLLEAGEQCIGLSRLENRAQPAY